jgi:hypothetical protein
MADIKRQLMRLAAHVKAGAQISDLYKRARFGWPTYDISHWLLNRTARKLYRAEKAKMQLNFVQQRIVDQLTENGIAIFNFQDLFPDKDLRLLQEPVESLIQNPIRPMPTAGPKHYILHPWGDNPVFDLDDPFLRMVLSDELLKIICSYLGMFCRLGYLNLWCNVPWDGPDVYSQRWHRDPEDKQLVKLFLYLRDVDEGSGPFCYIPRTHNKGPFSNIFPQTLLRSKYPGDSEINRIFTPDQMKMYTGKAGTFILCDTSGFHKGGHATEGQRLLFNAMYTTNACARAVGPNYSINEAEATVRAGAATYAIAPSKGNTASFRAKNSLTAFER